MQTRGNMSEFGSMAGIARQEQKTNKGPVKLDLQTHQAQVSPDANLGCNINTPLKNESGSAVRYVFLNVCRSVRYYYQNIN